MSETSNMISFRFTGAIAEYATIYHGWQQEDEVRRFNPTLGHTVDKIKERLRRVSHDFNDRRFEEYRWFLKNGDELVGTVSLKQINWQMKHGEIDYLVPIRCQTQGMATQGVRQFLQKIWHDTELEKVVATVHVDDLTSQNMMETLGFVKEGRLRKHVIVLGERIDQYIYGLLRAEWTNLA